MSQHRLTILLCFALAPLMSLAQKDSVWQTLKPSAQVLAKAQNKVSVLNTKADSLLTSLEDIPLKYIKQVDKKVEKYSGRLTSKTEKTLTKLSRWENKIKPLLEKASPASAAKLFGPGQMTFSSLLEKLRSGESVVNNYKAKYNEYRDKLNTSLKYIDSRKSELESKYVKPLEDARKKADKLEENITNAEAVEDFVRERKKQLIDEAIKYIGKSKYLTKINKESYYYIETLRNYKELFSDPAKAEQTAKEILNKIPAFKEFMAKNSMLASLFGNSGNAAVGSLAGLQTRQSVNDLIQGRIAGGGPNAQAIISQNLQQAQAELIQLKDKVLKAGGGSSNREIPDFKPNTQKTKTFLQRLEFGSNFQTARGNSLLPVTTDIGLTVGYKINDKSLIGFGASYKLGFGTIERIKFTSEGIGLRSFVDWKLKKQFFVTGGFEMNYNAGFRNVYELKNSNQWQQSGLIGLTKKLKVKTKYFKGTQLQLLYDVFSYQHNPVSQPVLFRVGYSF